ncbi:unnamed protein product, partial [Symbiodinium microadriaticum]
RSMGILEATDGDYLNGKFVNFATSYASTLEMDEDVVEGLDFASQFSPPFGTERQYLDLEVAAPAEEVLEHPAPAHVEEESGQPASPTAGEEAEGSDSRGLKAAKSAARRLLEDLVREQERQETMEAPPVPAPPVPHMPYSALEGARLGFLNREQIQDFVERSNVAKSVAKMRPSGPPMIPPAPPPVPAQVPRTLPPPPRVPAQVHRDRFQPYPPMWIMPFPAPVAHPAPMVFPPPVARPTQMVPKPAPTMARWIARGTPVPTEAPKPVPTGAPKTVPTEAPAVVPTTAPPPSPTTVPLSSPKAPNEMQLMGGPTYANGEPIYAGNHGDDGSED